MTLDKVYDFALSYWGRPYIWGGDGSFKFDGGVDCSGLTQLILSVAGFDPPGDQTAHGLYLHFLEHGTLNEQGLGALVFFGKREKVIHVGWAIDKKVMLNASGGGSHIRTVEQAMRYEAKVKLEPIRRRTDLVAVIMPKYETKESI